MNKCYNIVWNATRNMFMVVAEFVRGGGGTRRRICIVGAALNLTVSGICSVYAAEIGPQSGASITIENGDTITSTSGGKGIDSSAAGGTGVQINGKTIINVSGNSGPMTGINLDNGVGNQLGDGTEVRVSDGDKSGEVKGIFIDKKQSNTGITANGLNINVQSSGGGAYGFQDFGTGGNTDLGQGSTISVSSTSSNYYAYGVYLSNNSGGFKMDGGTINVTASQGPARGIDSFGNSGIDLGSGTQINVSSESNSIGIEVGESYGAGALNANALMLNVLNTRTGWAEGIRVGRSSSVDLGSGSHISLTGNANFAQGITAEDGGKFTADDLDLTLTTTNTATSGLSGRGISIDSNGSMDLGSGSTITVAGFTQADGIDMSSSSGSFTADHLTVDVTGNGWFYGIQMDGGKMDLGAGSSVSATGNAETIWITNGRFTASELTVKTQQSIGINVQGSSKDVTADVGAGSAIDGRVVGKNGTTSGICASDSGIGGNSIVNFNGTADNRNTIYAVNGYGASAQFYGQKVNMSNTDIIMSGGNKSRGLWAIGDNNLSNPGIINGENLKIDMTGSGKGSAGVMVQQGGSVNLTGETTIQTDGGIAIRNAYMTSSKDGTLLPGGTVTGSGKMDIEGDIISEGWGSIDLTMDAGSQFMGKTSVNNDIKEKNANATSTLNMTLADDTRWIITGGSSLTQLTSAGGLVFRSDDENGVYSTLKADEITLQDTSELDVDYAAATQAMADDIPLIIANNITLDGALNLHDVDTSGLENLTSDGQLAQQQVVLIDAATAINGNFSSLSKDASAIPDYLAFSGQINPVDNTQYLLGTDLSWYGDSSSPAARTSGAHGTFTLAAGKHFEVTRALVDVAPDPETGWDGKTLTKKGDGALILSGDNTYSGGTRIEEGAVLATNADALGSGDISNSGELVLDTDGMVNISQNITTNSGGTMRIEQGSTVTLNTLTQEEGSSLDVFLDLSSTQPVVSAQQANTGGDLNITGFTSAPGYQHTGTVTVIDAAEDITGDFDTLTIAGAPASQVDYITAEGRRGRTDATHYDVTLGLTWYADSYNSRRPADGSFTLANAGQSFTLDASLDDVAPNSASGWDGKSLTKQGGGTLILGAENTYSGTTAVQAGTLWLNPQASIGAAGSQQRIAVAESASFGGNNATVNGQVANSGSLYFAHTLTINGDVTNEGAIVSGSGDIPLPVNKLTSGDESYNTLMINGNYSGNGGSLTLNTYLGDDNSATDMLTITGDTSGDTTLYIKPTGGNGAATRNGIEVVDVEGASRGVFTQGNQVQAGLYEYRLYQDERDGDWYLRSLAVTPPDPDDGGDDDGGDVPVPPTPDNPQYRPDIGVYIGNQWMARSLQMQTLYDREGSQYHSGDGSVWARFKAGKAESGAVNGNVDIDNNYSQFQLGGDILAWNNSQQSFTVGLMGSYINANTDSTGNRGADGSRFSASGNVDGYNLGLYATWFADAQNHTGMYLDSWYQYGIYNNSVDNGDVGSENYDSRANALSLETGYRYDIALQNHNSLSLTPQAQAIWQEYRADSVTDNSGTHIGDQNSSSWTTRLGLRIDGRLYKDPHSQIQPFAELNWLHTNDDVAVAFDDARVGQELPADRGELKMGIQANINTQWSVRAQVTGQKGRDGYDDLSGSLNLRYSW
ncbi:autotransporter outer membrane beta-barrel domain-containing protein [Citrobacter sp. ku-bf4]|uniref:autotransporter outer membrane beta-barrel domain-containing protein n=1 Tax=Citrobacter TaxID=544 RepID=UPI001981545E|nr:MULTISPECIES: autotransporter outer membrane beta-barrel domain-containing protein [Citrobacter]MBN6045799.1 autotransporter outer membrane beta-barrel domain-containing protein [Citrobacter sp. ku-bf4]MBS0827175.1 autotransporter outer membrane beta-barrel domain-containing protein [Citrobacter amalonaticus]